MTGRQAYLEEAGFFHAPAFFMAFLCAENGFKCSVCVADLLHGVVLPSIDDDVDALHVGVHFNSLSFPKSCVFTHFLFEAFISIHLPLKSLSFHLQSGIFSIIDGRLLELPEDPSISAFGNNAWKNELGENEFDNSRGFY